MDERKAITLLKRRFEAAGFAITENVALDEDGIAFEVDGFDAERRVGYEYVSRESGDGWDVDEAVIAALAQRRADGNLSVLVVDEHDAPDEVSLTRAADAFLASLAKPRAKAAPPMAKAAEKPKATKAADKPKTKAAEKPKAKDTRKPKKK